VRKEKMIKQKVLDVIGVRMMSCNTAGHTSYPGMHTSSPDIWTATSSSSCSTSKKDPIVLSNGQHEYLIIRIRRK